MITITDTCAKQINALKSTEGNDALMLRIMVNGGGCQGFEYIFKDETTINDDDKVFEKDSAQIVIDEISLPYLEGAEIDYTDDLIGAHFKINNPNAASSCGCGTSFNVK